ncbi:EF_hand domain-containing protein [Hexamita inflata]|uniref:EF hand domain-containing protein n=1 Tax=Hexamita inflata TaxID=28002 RepID=A0AA86RBJ4_9EUKA|nr:EF hand domain-containing protein [Hexamita inflata]
MNTEQIKPVQRTCISTFNMIDKQKLGHISSIQLEAFLTKVFEDVNIEQAMCILSIMDIVPEAQINLEQFAQFMYIFNNAKIEILSSVLFYAADTNQSGKIDKNELSDIFRKLDIPVEDSQLQEAMETLSDETGEINYTQFTEYVESIFQI